MTSLQPVSRTLARRVHFHCCLSSSISSNSSSRLPCTAVNLYKPNNILRWGTLTSARQFHTSHSTFREDDNFGSSGRRQGGQTPRSGPINPGTNDAYSEGTPSEPKSGESLSSGIAPSTLYTFEDVQSMSASPESYPHRIIIDVREPAELLQTGRVPGARNVPITSAPDAFFLSPEDFEDKFGWERPGEEDEVIFYCRAGVRSKAAARLAGQAGFGGKVAEFPGSWIEWEEKGGEVQKE